MSFPTFIYYFTQKYHITLLRRILFLEFTSFMYEPCTFEQAKKKKRKKKKHTKTYTVREWENNLLHIIIYAWVKYETKFSLLVFPIFIHRWNSANRFFFVEVGFLYCIVRVDTSAGENSLVSCCGCIVGFVQFISRKWNNCNALWISGWENDLEIDEEFRGFLLWVGSVTLFFFKGEKKGFPWIRCAVNLTY